MKLPNVPSAGSSFSAKWASDLINYLRAITPRGGPGVRVRTGSGGTIIESKLAAQLLQVAETPKPFTLTDATESGTEKVSVRFGMVNSIMPTGMDPVDGQTINVTASGYVILAVTCTAGVATSAAISIAASVPANTATVGNIALGYVTLGTDVVTVSQSVQNSLQHQMCGTTTHLWGAV